MHLLLTLALCAAGTLMAQEGYPVTYPVSTKAPRTEKAKPMDDPARPEFDVHFLQADEYLVQEKGFKGGSGWERAWLAKLLTPASTETKGEAEFFVIAGPRKGEKLWTKHYCRTRPASKEDVKLGAVLYHYDHGTDEHGVYVSPRDREHLLEADWFVGTITDTSNLYKGFASLSEYKVRPVGLRIPIPATMQ